MEDYTNPGVKALLDAARERRLDNKFRPVVEEENVETKYYVLTYYRTGVGLFNDKEMALYYKRIFNQRRVSTTGQIVPVMDIFDESNLEEARWCAYKRLVQFSYCNFIHSDPSVVLATPRIFDYNLNIFITETVYKNFIRRIRSTHPNSRIIFI